MVQYDLGHLTQEPTQYVLGPIQDDEALFCIRSSRVCVCKYKEQSISICTCPCPCSLALLL